MIDRFVNAIGILCVLLLAACGAQEGDARESSQGASGAEARAASEVMDSVSASARASGSAHPAMAPAPIDSAQPMSRLIERFQRGLPLVTRLEHGAESRDSLVRGLVEALRRRDTSAVARAFITRAEFARLYFPASALARPPYEIDPAFAWFQLSSESEKGVHKALGVLGGREAMYLASTCEAPPEAVAAVRLWSRCTVRLRSREGVETEVALFGSIIEHGGRFKFFSYANRL